MTLQINGRLVDDFGVFFTHKTISEPKVKTSKVSIPLRSGDLDLTEVLSKEPHFDNRKITITLETVLPRQDWPLLRNKLATEYHGRRVTVAFGDDVDFFWRGKASVGSLKDKGSTAELTIEIDAEPFKIYSVPRIRDLVRPDTPITQPLPLLVSGYDDFNMAVLDIETAGTIFIQTDDGHGYLYKSGHYEHGVPQLRKGQQTWTISGTPGSTVTLTTWGGGL